MTMFAFLASMLGATLLEMLGDLLITLSFENRNDALQRVGTILTATGFAVLAALACVLHGMR